MSNTAYFKEAYEAGCADAFERAARIAESIQPSAASAVGEAHMRSFRDAIAFAIRAAAKAR